MLKRKTSGEISIQFMDFKKVNKYLNWKPKHQFEEKVLVLFDWYKKYFKKDKMALGIDFVGTNLGSGTKTYSLNFCNYLEQESLKEDVYIFLTKSYYDEITKKNNKNIFYLIKPSFYTNIFVNYLDAICFTF